MSGTAELENDATVEQQPTEAPTAEQPEKQESMEEELKKKRSKEIPIFVSQPGGKEVTGVDKKLGKREGMADVSSSREAEEGGGGGDVGKNEEKPYVYVPGKKDNERPSPEEEEAVMDDLFGDGMGSWRSAQERERLKERATQTEMMLKENWRKKLKEMGKLKEPDTSTKKEISEEMIEKVKKIKQRMGERLMAMLEERLKVGVEEEAEKGEAMLKMEYMRQIRESQGFDFDVCPRRHYCGLILRYFFDGCERNEELDDNCREALAKFNSLNGSDYEFVKVEKANYRLCGGFVYFITFQAKKPLSDSLVTFQARVFRPAGPKRFIVHFCRIRKENALPVSK